jgi:hypothetical protein
MTIQTSDMIQAYLKNHFTLQQIFLHFAPPNRTPPHRTMEVGKDAKADCTVLIRAPCRSSTDDGRACVRRSGDTSRNQRASRRAFL